MSQPVDIQSKYQDNCDDDMHAVISKMNSNCVTTFKIWLFSIGCQANNLEFCLFVC